MGSTPDHLNKATSTPAGEVGPFDTAIVVRLVVASIIFAVALILKLLPSVVSILLLLASAGAAGYDIAIEAVNSVEKGEYFATPLIIIVVTVLSFVIGFAAEGAALIILYQIGLILLAYTKDKTKKSALDLLHYQDSETAEKVASLIEQDEALELPIKGMMEHSSGTVLKFAIAFAVLYAIVHRLHAYVGRRRHAYHRACQPLQSRSVWRNIQQCFCHGVRSRYYHGAFR